MLASTRERRVNAGSKMTSLLNREDCDDFYKSTYGGFYDEEGDQEFSSPVESDTDEVDSDFDIDERDEAISDEDDENGSSKPKRSRLVITKAYQEPTYKDSDSGLDTPTTSSASTSAKRKKLPKKFRKHPDDLPLASLRTDVYDQKLRRSTIRKSEAAAEQRQILLAERNEQRAKHAHQRYSIPDVVYTQEELLEEAKQTEIENLKSLERFQQYELEKKKSSRLNKHRQIQGPVVRYFSTTMPCIEGQIGEKCARTFISCSDEKTFNELFPVKKATGTRGSTQNGVYPESGGPLNLQLHSPPTKRECVVTGLPANYVDPLTQLPYANSEAFKEIRKAYYKFVEENGDKNDSAVAKWLEYRKKVKIEK